MDGIDGWVGEGAMGAERWGAVILNTYFPKSKPLVMAAFPVTLLVRNSPKN